MVSQTLMGIVLILLLVEYSLGFFVNAINRAELS